jgi:hypothetical protein
MLASKDLFKVEGLDEKDAAITRSLTSLLNLMWRDANGPLNTFAPSSTDYFSDTPTDIL